MLKKYKFLILFFSIFVVFFSLKGNVFASTFTDKDLPAGCPLPSTVYDKLPESQKKSVSADKYAFFCITYTNDKNQVMKSYNYLFINADAKFCNGSGLFASTSPFVRAIFPDFDSSVSSVPANWDFYSVKLDRENDAYISLKNSSIKYFCSTFDIYNDVDYKNVYFLQTTPIFMGEVVQKDKTKVLQQVVNLLPLILVVVVSFLGLKKGLTLLFQALRKS